MKAIESPSPQRFIRMMWLSLPLLLAVLLYDYALSLPLFADDLPNLWMTENLERITEQWAGSYMFPYYRPTAFSVWYAVRALMGVHDPVLLHLLNVLVFGITGVLLSLVTRRLSGSLAAGVLAGCACVLFPFNFQPVLLVSSLFHLLLVFGIMLCLWSSLLWLDGAGNPAILIAGWTGALVGIFSHENGFLLAVLLAGLLIVRYRQVHRATQAGRWRRGLVAWAVPAMLSGVYLVLWLTVPRAEQPRGIGLSDDPARNLAMLIQGLIVPVDALWQQFTQISGVTLPVVPLILISAGGLVAGLLWLTWRQSPRLAVWAMGGLIGYGLAIGPSMLLLPSNYVADSPRLMMLASTGAGLFYAVVCLVMWQWSRIGRAVVAGTLLVTVVISGWFLHLREMDYRRMGDYTWQLVTMIQARDVKDDGLVLVNTPSYIGALPEQRTFLLGAETANYIPPELAFLQYIWLNTGILDVFPVTVTVDNATLPTPGYAYVPYLMPDAPDLIASLRDAPHIIATVTDGESIHPVYAGGSLLTTNSLPEDESGAVRYGEDALRMYAAQATLLDSERVQVESVWQVNTPQAVKRFQHVFCDGDFVGQADGYVWQNLYPFRLWEAGEIQADVRQIALSRPVTPDCLTIYTGLYSEADGVRLSATAGDGSRLPDDLVIVPLLAD